MNVAVATAPDLDTRLRIYRMMLEARRFEERAELRLGISPSTLARRLEGLSFAELEQFGLDVQRHYVLQLPDGNMRAIVAERLKQWRKRVPVTNRPTEPAGENDA